MSIRAAAHWLDERLGLKVLVDLARHKTVPVHKHSIWYYLGGITLFLFSVQVVTGILLMLYYRPSADEAFESVQFIVTRVSFGWLVRSIHSWSANLMVGAAFAHLFSVFFLRAYRKPREVTWFSGVLLLFLSMGFGFSGYLLPWNTLAFFATRVGTDIAGAVPVVGEWMRTFLRGGQEVTGGTLSRFYGWHVAILPAVTSLLLGLHVYLVQRHGMSRPEKAGGNGEGPVMPFVPNFLLRDIFGWTVALALLAALAAYAPWELGVKADPFAPAPPDIKPEWYFMFMFETLKLIPGGEIVGIEFEAIAILSFGFGGLLLLLVPFFDNGTPFRAKIVRIAGWAVLAFMVGMTSLGYHSLWPLVLTTGGVLLIYFAGIRGFFMLVAGASLCLLGSADLVSAQQKDRDDSCLACHKTLEEVAESLYAPTVAWADDIHKEKGLTCADCHGGDASPALFDDAEASMDPDKGFTGAPERLGIPEFCGRCHADAAYMKQFNPAARVDQLSEYRTSGHGIANAKGDERVAVCTDCHGVHGIRTVKNPASPAYPTAVPDTCVKCHGNAELMSNYSLDPDVGKQWARSVHAEALLKKGDLSAPACNDCHGNHGAVPPGVTSLAFVCGHCHGRESQLFRESWKRELFDDLEVGECVTCHSNHDVKHPSDEWIGTGEKAVCSQCHEPGDACDQASIQVRAAIDRYTIALERADEILKNAESAGMEVSDARYSLNNEGVTGLVDTRALIHSFDTERLIGTAEDGVEIADAAYHEGEKALKELKVRKKGLALSLVFIFFLLAALYAKIRATDRRTQ